MASTSPSGGRERIQEGVRNKQADRERESTLWDNTCTCDPALTSHMTQNTQRRIRYAGEFSMNPPKKATLWSQSTVLVFVPFSSELFVATSRMIKLFCPGICGIA